MNKYIAYVYDTILFCTKKLEFECEASDLEAAMLVANSLFSNNNKRVTQIIKKVEDTNVYK